ncbi:MAG TPA: hypothetical protein VI277_00995 [Candidatus Limnocylindria bacterium]
MTDGDLDPRRARELRAYAEGGVRPIHAMAIAEAAVDRGSGHTLGSVGSWLGARGREVPNAAPRVATRAVAAGLAVGLAAAAIIAVAANSLMPASGVVGASQPVASATTSPTVWPSRSPTAADTAPGPAAFSDGRHAARVGGVRLSFGVPAGWDPFGSFLVSKSVAGPQGAEAILFWAAFPDGEDADPCINAPIEGWSAADVAAGIAAAPGTELVTPPTDVSVGGHAAKHVVVVVREDAGCDPGFFYNWKAQTGGSLWVTTELGDRISVWVVDVDGQLVFIAGEVHQNLAPNVPLTEGGRARLEQEIQEIVDSIRFD